ncbi:hypothetical protein [Lachnoclostridium sp. Marseille-P6806]|uniref:hypothetical protein n=1 Tax=Lachnoclostridium sp. Marseille-P6806 TaxID=2364793 RepID=UPI0013EF341A|nr:hypothetical protein [Lachnoclostridium sp. Marseille-P6806]
MMTVRNRLPLCDEGQTVFAVLLVFGEWRKLSERLCRASRGRLEKYRRDGAFHGALAEAVRTVLWVFRTEQRHEELSSYRFERSDCPWTDRSPGEGAARL